MIPRHILLTAIAIASASAVGPVSYCQELFSPRPASRPRVLMDYYHKKLPQSKVGRYLLTGGRADNVGRYGFNDFSHTNSFDALFLILEREFALYVNRKPFTTSGLSEIDIVLIINPEHPDLAPDIPVISDAEIEVLREFVKEGGSLMVMINAGGRGTERFEEVQTRKLLRNFGLDWYDNDTSYTDIALGPQHPYFYDIDVFHYGAGCTIKILPDAQEEERMLEVHEDEGSPKTRGPGLVMVRHGKGKVMVVGDTGSWGANMARPWAQNEIFLKQMFRHLKRDNDVKPAAYFPGQSLLYDARFVELAAIPVRNTINQVRHPEARVFQPTPRTELPYLESEGKLRLRCVSESASGARKFEAWVDSFARFEETTKLSQTESISFGASRQGNVFDVEAQGKYAAWMAPDIGHLIALLPHDGIRLGDRWEKVEQLRIIPIQSSDSALTRPVETKMTYLRDEVIGKRRCRLIRTQARTWLADAGVRVEDLLPHDWVRKWSGSNFELVKGRGGTLIFRREQWVDAETGVVVKSEARTGITVWIRDLSKPLSVSNEDRDQTMLTTVSHMAMFELKP